MKIKYSKAQISIEVIIVVIFLVIFIHTFSDLADDTIHSLEISKIKEQHNNIILSLDEFLELQSGLLGNSPDFNIVNYNSSFDIPEIVIPSQKVSCKIDINSDNITINTIYNNREIKTSIDTLLSTSDYVLPITLYCGQKLECTESSNKLDCS